MFSVFFSQLDNVYRAQYQNFYRTVINGFRYALDIFDGPNNTKYIYFNILLHVSSNGQFCNYCRSIQMPRLICYLSDVWNGVEWRSGEVMIA